MRKIVFIVSSPTTIKAFLMPFINELRKENQMHLIAHFDDDSNYDFIPKDVIVHKVSIERNPNLLKDLFVLFQLIKLINIEKFDVVHSFTPKAGLLAQIAAFLNRTKSRYHTFTGQVWASKSGVKRYILKQMDFLTASLTSYNLVDSPSQREFLIANHVTSSKKSFVLGNGSISGVNLEKFKYCQEKRKALRDSLGLGADDFVFLYAGRLKVDKGIPELFAAFNNISKVSNSSLVLVGIDEDNLLPIIKDNKRVIFCGFTDDIAAYFSMADLLCLPSHREGFGNVIIEAAVCGLPSLGADIYGLSDAIADRQTGLLHTVRDTKDIETKMLELYTDRVLLKDLGSKAEKRAKSFFSERLIVEEFVSFYKRKQI